MKCYNLWDSLLLHVVGQLYWWMSSCEYIWTYRCNTNTVGSHLSELQLSEHVGYPNTSSKATPTISGYIRRPEAVQMADIECFRARSTCCIAAEDTGYFYGQGT